MSRRYLVAVLAAVGTTIALAGTAWATVPSDDTYVGGTANQLRTHSFNADGTKSTCSKITAENTRKTGGTDSPLDQSTNHNDFVAHICPGGYIEVYTDASLNNLQGMKVSDLKNIGFDFRTADVTGAGQVYIAIILQDGNYLFLDAAHCSTVIAGTQWSTTHFTEPGAVCTVYDSSGTGYSATATQSALQVFQAAYPDATVDYTYLLVSGVQAAATDVHLDRIMLGTGYSYDYSKLYAHKLAA
jgi:hypothetical protein